MRHWKINRIYFVAAAIIAAAIYWASLALFPDWGQSIKQLAALAAAAIGGALTIASGVWAGLEKPEPPAAPVKSTTIVGGDAIGGNKTVDQRAGGDIAGRDKITTQTATEIINAQQVQINAAAQAGVLGLHQLPSPPADFTGRTAELADLRQAIHEQGATISGLRGLGGVGKTALALVLANELAAGYPDAQIFLNLQGVTHPLKPEEIMAHVLRAYKPVEKLPDDLAQLAAAYRTVLHGQRGLLLLDNASDAAQIKPLLPPPGCLLLVTSRSKFALPGLRAVNLESLPPVDAQALLLKRAPRIGGHAAALAELCACLPLALTLAGDALAERENLEPADYVRRLGQARLTVFDEVAASLTLSYDLLTSELQGLWRALAVFPADFAAPAAAAVWSLEADPGMDRLGDLLRYSLLEFDTESKRYRLHDLARDFVRSRWTEPERDDVQRRHVAHYKDVLATANALYKKGGEAILSGLALFDLERANIVTGQAWAATHAEQDDAAARLASDYPLAGAYVLDLRQHPHERIVWLESALAAARRLKDRGAESAHLGNLGLAYSDLGDAREAIQYHEQVLPIMREIGDRSGEGAALSNLGNDYEDLGDARRAIEYYQQQLKVTREIGDRRGEGNALGNLGVAYKDLGDARRAIEYHEQALVIAREIGDRRGEGQALGSLGVAYEDLGDARRAIEYYQQQLAITREIGDRQGESIASWNLGLIYEQQGELGKAISLIQFCVDFERELGHPAAEADAARVEVLRKRLAGG